MDADGYSPEDDGPEAWLFRRDAEREAAWGRFTALRADVVLGSLTPVDAHRHLPSWEEIKAWQLRRR